MAVPTVAYLLYTDTLLRAGVPLPMNFSDIPLNNIQRQKLAALGIRYDPMTGDREDAAVVDLASNDSE